MPLPKESFPMLAISGHKGRVYDFTNDRFDLGGAFNQVNDWVVIRPPIKQQDSNIEVMGKKNITGEVTEAQTEREKEGTKLYDPKAEQTEAVDILFFIFALAIATNIPLDSYEVKTHVDGYGRRDDIFSRMIETSGNMEAKSLTKDLNHLAGMWISYAASLPERLDPDKILQLVLDKNSRNYPHQFFTGIHPITGEKLNPEGLKLAYDHARMCLKFIRNLKRDMLGLKDRDYGLLYTDYAPYGRLILDYLHSEQSFRALQIQAYLDHQLPVPTELLK